MCRASEKALALRRLCGTVLANPQGLVLNMRSNIRNERRVGDGLRVSALLDLNTGSAVTPPAVTTLLMGRDSEEHAHENIRGVMNEPSFWSRGHCLSQS